MGTSAARPLRILIAPLVAAILTFGVWVTGGVLTDDFKTSVTLTAAWFIVAGAVCGWVARSLRGIRVPVAIGYIATVVGLGGYLGWTSMHDEVVHEHVVVGTPASRVAAPPTTTPTERRTATRAPAHAAGPVQLAAGRFRSGEHSTTGRAAIVRLTDGRLVLTLAALRTSPGPDLRVRLVPGDSDRGDAPGNRDLGALKGNIGDQQYDVPARTPVAETSVIIWCRAFTATFGAAKLTPS